MADSDSSPSSSPSPTAAAPLSSKRDNMEPIGSKIAELSESRSELLTRIQGLKQDLQNWRSKLDTQVKIYRDDLSELKKSLNVEVEQLRLEFKELKTTLRQQHEDVTASLKNLGLQDLPEAAKGEPQDTHTKGNTEEVLAPTPTLVENGKESSH